MADYQLPGVYAVGTGQRSGQLVGFTWLDTTSAGSVQLLYPSSDISTGAWTPSTGTTLYATVDEAAYDDADYIQASTASTCEMKFGAGSDPLSSVGHVLKYRLLPGSGNIAAVLKCGSTTIASFGPHALTGSAQDFVQTLSGTQADSITDYADLRIVFTSS